MWLAALCRHLRQTGPAALHDIASPRFIGPATADGCASGSQRVAVLPAAHGRADPQTPQRP